MKTKQMFELKVFEKPPEGRLSLFSNPQAFADLVRLH